jgi:hypothetical protein
MKREITLRCPCGAPLEEGPYRARYYRCGERICRDCFQNGDAATAREKRCSACGSTAPHHVAYVESHGLCVV